MQSSLHDRSCVKSVDCNLPCVLHVKRVKQASKRLQSDQVSNKVVRGLPEKQLKDLGKSYRVVEWRIVHGYQLAMYKDT